MALEAQAGGQVGVHGLEQRFLGQAHRQRGFAGNAAGDLQGALNGEFRLRHFADQPGALGLARIDRLAGQDHLHGHGFADGTQQALGATGAGHDPEVDFRLTEARVLTGNDDVGVHRQFAATAEGEAIDGGDQGFAEAGDRLPRSLAGIVEDADQVAFGHFLDVGASGEGLAATGEDHGAGLGVGLCGAQFVGQLTQQLGGQGVQGLRALQGNQADAGLDQFDGKG